MQKQIESPIVQEHFPEPIENDNEEDKQTHKVEAIKSFALQQITLSSNIFKHCLNESHVYLILAILIPAAMASVLDIV